MLVLSQGQSSGALLRDYLQLGAPVVLFYVFFCEACIVAPSCSWAKMMTEALNQMEWDLITLFLPGSKVGRVAKAFIFPL